MNFPPMLLKLKIIDGDRRINLWLPLFLVWFLVLLAAIIISPLVCLAVILLWPWGWGEMLLLLGPAVYRVLCGLRGLQVDIKRPGETILVYFR